MQLYVDGKPKGRSSTLGAKYFEEFSERFWEKPSKYFIFFFYLIHKLI
jgi:hypothetical protein